MPHQPVARADAWQKLRALTPARIALGRAGASVPTAELLDFQLAHARARDAVHAPFDACKLAEEIGRLDVSTLCLTSGAADRAAFLRRPDWGRRLDDDSREALALAAAAAAPCENIASAGEDHVVNTWRLDLAIVVSDGLSALAAQRQVVPLLAAWLPLLRAERRSLAPIVIVEHGRVAIEDEIGHTFAARVAVILIGERPGLGSPDSLGAYLVFGPRAGLSDADRNCLSNIRPQGLPPEAAALRLHYLFRESLARKLSGVALKDESVALETTVTGMKPVEGPASG
ncbi:MAG TPA: ethanolamine ammonia-lyase subunit EutC [Pirellulales bacterium]|nr:ethanolamine ammonia-lyase subunit EutC [Pirellulales bacterium]